MTPDGGPSGSAANDGTTCPVAIAGPHGKVRMSGDSPKVTVIRPNKVLRELILAADNGQKLKEVPPAPDRPVYEYDPAIYVHVPIPLDLRPLPKGAIRRWSW